MPSQAMMDRAAKLAASIIRNMPEDCGDLTLEIEAIATFGEAIERETDWQPIETAPKDGKDFLAWCVERAPWSSLRGFVDLAHWHAGSNDFTGYFKSRTGAIPTHWRPLPAPPNQTTEGADSQ